MLSVSKTKKFQKQLMLCIRQGKNKKKLDAIVNMLANEQPLPPKNRDHKLEDSKRYKGCRECHIEPDWLLVYKVVRNTLVLELIATGSHSELFSSTYSNACIRYST